MACSRPFGMGSVCPSGGGGGFGLGIVLGGFFL